MTNDFSLVARNLECIRDTRALFTDLTFSVQSKQMLLLEGRNGSGKTSLLRMLCGIRLPDAGSVKWCGEDIYKLGAEYREYFCYVGHKDAIKQDLTPYENLRIAQVMGNSRFDRSIDEALEQFDLYGYEDLLTRNLSAGQQRKLSLARLVVTESPLWLLDEPFTSLDRDGIKIVQDVMAVHLETGGMIILTTHHKVDLDGPSLQRIDLSQCISDR